MAQLILVIVTHVVIPLGSLGLLLWKPAESRVGWWAQALAMPGPAALMYAGGAEWSLLSIYAREGMGIAAALALAAAWIRRARTPAALWPRGVRQWLNVGMYATLAAVFGASVYGVVASYYPQERGFAIAPALAHPRTYVANGGAGPTVNRHHDVRAQRHALDLVALTPAGRRVRDLAPESLADYVAYGVPVVAPCSGRVAAVRDRFVDRAVASAGDRNQPAGNYVMLHCDEVTILLAHLQPNSITVRAGESVRRGTPLGAIGNTGNTTEPHLHVHAVRGRTTSETVVLYEGTPVPLLIGPEAQYPVRGQVIASRS